MFHPMCFLIFAFTLIFRSPLHDSGHGASFVVQVSIAGIAGIAIAVKLMQKNKYK
jgi:hypothetical protein